MYNPNSLDTLAASLAYAMGIEAPNSAAPANTELCRYVDEKLGAKRADRLFMYNPDAIGEWVFEKYSKLFTSVMRHTELSLPLCTVMPSVTPVCFGTMYTGVQPEVHGIRKYEKPVIKTDSLFDALLRAGKKCAIVAESECSMAKIFLERDMDYFIYETIEEVNAKACELIMRDEYDMIAVYNGNYDAFMHRYAPESIDALCEARANDAAFAEFCVLIERYWTGHDTLVGFAMDHGCHEIDGSCGSHGLDMPEDIEIMHFYKGYPKGE